MYAGLFTLVSIIFLTSCSGPQMISSPPQPEVGVPISKKTGSKEIDSKEDVSEERGVFDSNEHSLKTDLSQWKLIDEDDGIQTDEKIKSNSGLVAFRGEILIPAPLKKVATILVEDALQKDWVDSYVESKTISVKSELESIEYNQTKVPWPFQNRDFVFRVFAKVNAQPATMLITMKSVEDPSMPPVSGVVRGEIIHSYYYLKEMAGLRATKMVVEMEVDPKGAIPLWLVNISQKGWPHNTLSSLKKLSLRDDIQVLPKLDKYFEVKTKEKSRGRKKK